MGKGICPKDCPDRTTGKDRVDCHNDSCPIWAKHMEATRRAFEKGCKKQFINDAIHDCDDRVMKKLGRRKY